MKRLLTLALSAAMLFCPITSYAAQTEEAKAVYQEMVEKSNSQNDVHAYYDITLQLSGSVFDDYKDYLTAEDLTMRLEMDISMKNANDISQMQLALFGRLNMLGEQETFTMHYADGYMYMDMAGDKEKAAMPLDSMEELMSNTELYSSLMTSDTYIKDLSVRTDGESRILSYTLDDSKLNQLIQAVLRSAGYSYYLDGFTTTIRNVHGNYVVTPDGNYSDASIHMEMDMSYEGETIIFIIDGKIGVPNPGEEVIMPAFDRSGYTEV